MIKDRRHYCKSRENNRLKTNTSLQLRNAGIIFKTI